MYNLLMVYVYVLRSEAFNQWYIGYTPDLKRRLETHNTGKVESTKRYMPWKLIYYEAYTDEFLARQRERKLKHHGRGFKELKKRIYFSES